MLSDWLCLIQFRDVTLSESNEIPVLIIPYLRDMSLNFDDKWMNKCRFNTEGLTVHSVLNFYKVQGHIQKSHRNIAI